MNTTYDIVNFITTAQSLISYYFQKAPVSKDVQTALLNLLLSPLEILEVSDTDGRINWTPIFFDLFNQLENSTNEVKGDALDRLGDFLGQERISIDVTLIGTFFTFDINDFNDPAAPYGDLPFVSTVKVSDKVYIDILRARIIKMFGTGSINDFLKSLGYLFDKDFSDMTLSFPDANTVDINLTESDNESFNFMLRLFEFQRISDNDFLWIRPIRRAVYNLVQV